MLIREAVYTRFLEILAQSDLGIRILLDNFEGDLSSSDLSTEAIKAYKQIEEETGIRVNGSLIGLYGEKCLWGDVRRSIAEAQNPEFLVLERAMDRALKLFHEEAMEVLNTS